MALRESPLPLGSSIDLGGNDNGFASDVGVQESPQHGLAGTDGIDVGRVEEVDAKIQGLFQEEMAGGLIQRPSVASGLGPARGGCPVSHASEADARDLETGLAQVDIVHGTSIRVS
jgi:hypothetical protein